MVEEGDASVECCVSVSDMSGGSFVVGVLGSCAVGFGTRSRVRAHVRRLVCLGGRGVDGGGCIAGAGSPGSWVASPGATWPA